MTPDAALTAAQWHDLIAQSAQLLIDASIWTVCTRAVLAGLNLIGAKHRG